METTPKKINLGSGKDYRDGYTNVDNLSMWKGMVDVNADLKMLKYEGGDLDEILASHIAMYIDTIEMPILLKRWLGWLKEGGKLVIETGDLKKVAKIIAYSEKPEEINGTNGVMQLFGWAETKGHTWAWCYETLEPLLLATGFKKIERIDGGYHNRPERDITITAWK